MTERQRGLARFALGFVYGKRRSYRNRFAAAIGSRDYEEWRAMVNAGYAMRVPWFYSYGDHFFMTRAGAEAVLKKNEKLDPEDFPMEEP